MVRHLVLVDLRSVLEELIEDRLLLIILDAHSLSLNGTALQSKDRYVVTLLLSQIKWFNLLELMLALLSLIVVTR